MRRHPALVEIEVDAPWTDTVDWSALFPGCVLGADLKIDPGYLDSGLRLTPAFQKKLESLISSPFDILCLTSDYDPEKGYYPTTDAVPAVHRFLVERKIRHRFSILAAGGIRSAADAQKTIQRGANGVKIDWPVLLTADPLARQKFLAGKPIEFFRRSLDPGQTDRQSHPGLERPGHRGSGRLRLQGHQEDRRGREPAADLRRSGGKGLRHLPRPRPSGAKPADQPWRIATGRECGYGWRYSRIERADPARPICPIASMT